MSGRNLYRRDWIEFNISLQAVPPRDVFNKCLVGMRKLPDWHINSINWEHDVLGVQCRLLWVAHTSRSRF